LLYVALSCDYRFMSKRRHTYTYNEAQTVLTAWIARRKMSQREFAAFLSGRGVLISPQTCSALVAGKITPGPMFKKVFHEITGIKLVDGLVEES